MKAHHPGLVIIPGLTIIIVTVICIYVYGPNHEEVVCDKIHHLLTVTPSLGLSW